MLKLKQFPYSPIFITLAPIARNQGYIREICKGMFQPLVVHITVIYHCRPPDFLWACILSEKLTKAKISDKTSLRHHHFTTLMITGGKDTKSQISADRYSMCDDKI